MQVQKMQCHKIVDNAIAIQQKEIFSQKTDSER